MLGTGVCSGQVPLASRKRQLVSMAQFTRGSFGGLLVLVLGGAANEIRARPRLWPENVGARALKRSKETNTNERCRHRSGSVRAGQSPTCQKPASGDAEQSSPHRGQGVAGSNPVSPTESHEPPLTCFRRSEAVWFFRPSRLVPRSAVSHVAYGDPVSPVDVRAPRNCGAPIFHSSDRGRLRGPPWNAQTESGA